MPLHAGQQTQHAGYCASNFVLALLEQSREPHIGG